MTRLDESNRSERYWTTTILSSLLLERQFLGLKIFMRRLCDGTGQIPFRTRKDIATPLDLSSLTDLHLDYENVEFSTELWHERDISAAEYEEHAVPDIIVLIASWLLIVCEAKFFQRVNRTYIERQLAKQKLAILPGVADNRKCLDGETFLRGLKSLARKQTSQRFAVSGADGTNTPTLPPPTRLIRGYLVLSP